MEADETTAEDVVEALRIIAGQDEIDPEVLRTLLGKVPAGRADRGIRLLIDEIGAGRLTVKLATVPF